MVNTFLIGFASLALLVYPATVLALDYASGAAVILVLLAAVIYALGNLRQVVPFSRQEKLFFIALSLIFISAVVTTLLNETELARANRFLYFVLIIPVYVMYKQAPISEKYIWVGLVSGALIAFLAAIYQVFGSAQSARATGSVHPILFGDLALLMGLLSLAGLGWFKQQKKWLMIVPVIAAVAGLVASALSQSRGGWAAIPFIGLVLLWYLSRFVSIKWVATIVILAVAALSAIYLTPQFKVQQRVQTTVQNIDRYLHSQGPNDPARITSIGARFEMWKSAWVIFTEHPLVGAGWGNFKSNTQQLVDEGLLNKGITRFYHAHNQYLSALAKGGVIALLAILALFLVPAYLFVQAIRSYDDPVMRRMAFAGLILIVGYMCFGLSEAILEKTRPVVFFAFYLAVFMSRMQRVRLDNR